jgi:hypothetical protein
MLDARFWSLAIKGIRFEDGGWRLKSRMIRPQTSNSLGLSTLSYKSYSAYSTEIE